MDTTVLTNSYGSLRRGRVWFTTSPEQLKRSSEPKKRPTLPEVVIRRRQGQEDRITTRS